MKLCFSQIIVDDDVLPVFTKDNDCPEDVVCVKVQYRDTPRSRSQFRSKDESDMLILKPDIEEPSVLKGHLKSNSDTKVVVVLADEDNPQDMVTNV